MKNYLAGYHNCRCGREHSTSLKEIEISKDAHKKLPELLERYGYHSVYLIADQNTMKAAGEEVLSILTKAHILVTVCLFEEETLIPNETALGKLLAKLPTSVDLVMSVGTGTLNDLGKYISDKFHLPFYIVATAPSMDGFASNVSCLILEHMKTTLPTHVPEAIIADLSVLAAAPSKMIAAGIGDILGKYIALLDWKLSSVLTGEYHCEYVETMVRQSIDTIISTIDEEQPNELSDSDRTWSLKAVGKIMEALVLSGIAMSFVGNSRPASGSEHHLSHFWELDFLQNNLPPVLHGIKVGIGTVTAIRLYRLLLTTVDTAGAPDFESAHTHIENFSYPFWQSEMRQYYGQGADEVLRLEEQVHKNGVVEVSQRLDILKQHWCKIEALIKSYLPSYDRFVSLLEKAGAPTKPKQEAINSTLVYNSILFAKELRNRYGLLQLLFDLGLSEIFATQLAELTEEEL